MFLLQLLTKMAFSPLRPLPPLHREPRKSRPPDKLEALAMLAIPYPGEGARENLPTCHSVRIKLEAREFEEAKHESKKEHATRISQGVRTYKILIHSW